MINLDDYKQKVESAITESEIEELTHAALQATDLVALEFIVEKDFLSFSFLADKKATGPDRLLGGLRLPMPRETRTVEKNTRYIFNDLKTASPYSDILALLIHRDCSQAAILIAAVEQKPHRLYAIGSRNVVGFDRDDVEQVKSFLDSVTRNLERIHASLASEKLSSVYPAIMGIGEIFSHEKNLAKAFELLHKNVERIFPEGINFVSAIKDEKNNQITFPFAYLDGKSAILPSHDLGEGIYSYIIEKNDVLEWDSQPAQTVQKLNIIERSNLPKSFFGVPINYREKTIGMMAILDFGEENSLSNFEKSFFKSLAAIFSVYIHTLQSEEDISQLETKIQRERIYLKHLLSNCPIQLSIKDSGAKYVFASRTFLERYNFSSEEEIVGKSDLNILSESEGINAYKDDLEIISLGKPKVKVVTESILPNGETILISHDKYPVKDGTGNVTGLIEFSWDDSELRKMEQKASQLQTQVLAVKEIVNISASSLKIPEIIQQTLNLISEKVKPYHAAVFTLDALRENIILQKAIGEYGRLHEQKELKVKLKSKSIFNKVFTELSPYLIRDVDSDPLYSADPLLSETKEVFLLPLISNRNINGMMELRSSSKGFFNDELKEFLGQVATLLSVAISNSSQSERISETLAKQQSLYSITISATEASNPQEALQVVVDNLAKTIPDSQPSFFLPNAEGKLTIAASKGYSGIKVQDIIVNLGEGIVGQAAETLKPIRIEDTVEDESFIPIDPSARSEIAIPVTFQGRLLGVLNIENKRVNAFDENDEQILVTLGNTLGSILSNVQLISQIRQQAERQRQLYEISEKIRRSVDIESIIQTSAIELGKAIRARRANVEVKPLTQLVSETGQSDTEKGAKS